MNTLLPNNAKWSCSNLDKEQLRKQLFAIRNAIPSTQCTDAAHAAASLFSQSYLFETSMHIACYSAFGKEFTCAPLMEAIWKAEKKCYLPILSSQTPKLLYFALYNSTDALIPNRYQILEPKNPQFIPIELLDIVLVPLVGFDQKGNRLGMGGGYYDNTFAYLTSKKTRKPLLIGLAYSQQQFPQLPHDDWDVVLDGVLTEKQLLLF